MPEALSVVAAFDVDGTLTKRDCVTPFLFSTVRWRTAFALVRHPFTVLRAVGRQDRDLLKEVACTAFAGYDAELLDEKGEAFAKEIGLRRLRGDTVARLRWHLELGHRVVLASASLEPYLLPLGRLLGVDGVVCTRLEQGPDGRLTGRLDGANCRGPEKERRVVEWLREHDLADATLWAYGDSRGDAELLARADHPVWVRGRTVETMPVNHMEQ